ASNPQILRKSLTEWLAWPAEPPTPSTKRRPPRARTSARPLASASTASTSSFWMSVMDSSRKVRVKVMRQFLSPRAPANQPEPLRELADQEPALGDRLAG